MVLYEIEGADGKRRRYRTLALAKAAFSPGDRAIYAGEWTYPEDGPRRLGIRKSVLLREGKVLP